jgi:hypothetical protein
MERLVAAWRRYWFTPASLTDLGFSRVVLAGIVLWLDGMGRFIGVALRPPAFWTPVASLTLLGLGQPSLVTLQWMALVNAGLLIAVALGIGARLALLLLLPLQLYQEALLNCFGKVSHGTIPVLYALLFFLLGPSDRGFSLGAIWRRAREAGRSVVPRESRLSPDARWPLHLVFVELAAYYCLAGFSKLNDSGFAWADGYALQYYLLSMYTDTGRWLAGSLGLCRAFSWLVLAFELSTPLGMFQRLRPLVLSAGVLFNLGTWWFMNILFWPTLALFLLFIPWTRVGRALARWTGFANGAVPVRYDGSCARCRRTVSVLRDLDLAGRLHFAPVADTHLVAEPGGVAGLRRIAWSLPAAWPIAPLLYLPGATQLGRRLHASQPLPP